MAEKVKDIIEIIEGLAPKKVAESWDNVGLQVGGLQDEVRRVMVCLDITEKVLEEAIEKKAELVISHHPLIFKPMKHILKDEEKGKIIYKAIQNNIAFYAAHTNIDVVMGGLNDQLALKLGFKDTEILQVTNQQEFYKIVVFVPEGHEDRVADALATAGAGNIGNYSHCSFRSKGTGTFVPLEGTNPFIGGQGKLEKAEEIRLETIIKKENVHKALDSMIEAHPYEEVAYDLYPLGNKEGIMGVGRMGVLDNPIQASLLIEEVKALLGLEKVKFTGNVNSVTERVAVVNGSGADYIFDAIKAKCDCLITGDIKYHEAQMALDHGLNIIDIGHFESEIIFVEWLTEYLDVHCQESGLKVEVIPSESYINPFQYL